MISQFTLYGKLKGNTPTFTQAMDPSEAEKIYETLVGELRKRYKPERIHTGVFGADMKVEIANDGPCTILLEYD